MSELLVEVVLPAVLGLLGAAFGEGFQDTAPADDHHAHGLVRARTHRVQGLLEETATQLMQAGR